MCLVHAVLGRKPRIRFHVGQKLLKEWARFRRLFLRRFSSSGPFLFGPQVGTVLGCVLIHGFLILDLLVRLLLLLLLLKLRARSVCYSC